jgi:hypothetical protein
MSLSYALSQIPVLATLIRNGDWSLNGGLIWITSFMLIGLALVVVGFYVNPVPRSSKRIRTLPATRN